MKRVSGAQPIATRPRRAGLFTPVPKQTSARLQSYSCSLQEVGLYMAMFTDPDTSALGYVYRKHEWENFAQSNRDTVDLTLRSLEDKELIVTDGPHIIILGYMPEQAFNQPRYLRSGLWDLQRSLSSPVLRFFVGAQLLGLSLTGMEISKANGLYDAAQPLWYEITDGEHLPPIHYMHGNLDEPDRTMVGALTAMPEHDVVRMRLDRGHWAGVPTPLREPIREGFDAQVSAVTSFTPRGDSRTRTGT